MTFKEVFCEGTEKFCQRKLSFITSLSIIAAGVVVVVATSIAIYSVFSSELLFN